MTHNSWGRDSQLRQRGAIALLLTVFVLASIGPLLCVLLCDGSQPTVTTIQSMAASQPLEFSGISHTPGSTVPTAPVSAHCLAHHACSQLSLLLAVIYLTPFLLVLGPWFQQILLAPQPANAPITPPPQLAYR